jgi:hypothetical protein
MGRATVVTPLAEMERDPIKSVYIRSVRMKLDVRNVATLLLRHVT